MKIGLVFVLLFSWHISAWSQAETELELTESLEAKNRWLNIPRWSLSYGVTTDLNDPAEPRLFTNRMAISARSSVKHWFQLGAGLGVRYFSLDRKIRTAQEDVEVSDFTVSGLRVFQLPNFLNGEHSVIAMASNVFPTGQKSRYQGYRSILRGSTRVISQFWAGLYSLTHTGRVEHIFNTYSYSPVEPFGSQPVNRFSYSLTNHFQPFQYFGMGLKLTTSLTRFLDGANDAAWANTSYIQGQWKRLVATLSYTNGNYADDRTVELWFIDDYRQLVTFTLMYRL